MPGHGEKLNRKQEALVAALLTAPTIKRAAEAVRISEKTARRWLQLPGVQEAYRSARREVVEQAQTLLQRASIAAVETLLRNMQPTAPAAVQVRSALGILELVNRAVELDELHERLAALEALIAEGEQQKGNLLI